jgi:hypothetical protein
MGIVRNQNIEEDLNTRVDRTSDPGYAYISENIRPDAVDTDTDWRIYRVTEANGTAVWADGDSSFNKQASLAVTEYSYTE